MPKQPKIKLPSLKAMGKAVVKYREGRAAGTIGKSATMEKRFNLTLDELKQILTIAHEDLESVDHKNQEAEARTISIVFKRGRDIFNL